MKAKNLQLSAGVLRIILAVSLFVIMAGAVAGFVFAHQKLTGYAVDISKKKVDAEASETVIQSLETITKQLEDNEEVRKTASSLRLDDNHPEFSVSKELRSIAARNNITLSLTTTSPTTDGTTPPPASTPSPTPTPAASSDTFSITMAVRPKGKEVFNEASFKDFLQFLRDLEQNLPKIKVNGVRVSGGAAEDSDPSGTSDEPADNNGISVEPISLEVYIKQ